MICTNKYFDDYSLLLDSTPDFIDGKDARRLIEQIFNDTEGIKQKSVRVKTIKNQILNRFHLIGKAKKPKWIQSPEWPFLNDHPMMFVSQKNEDDKVIYIFRDVDSNETVNVIQYY